MHDSYAWYEISPHRILTCSIYAFQGMQPTLAVITYNSFALVVTLYIAIIGMSCDLVW